MPRFQVGDIVRVIENTQRAPYALQGQIGAVTQVPDKETAAEPQEPLYTVRFYALGRELPVYESALEEEPGQPTR